MKIVINDCCGGFSLSTRAVKMLNELGKTDCLGIDRTDTDLIVLVEKKGTEFASGRYAKLKVVEIPDEATDWEIDEHDNGYEEIIAVVNGKIKHFY